jgi:2-polyprenyl-3-methyl-5-hydroxy-6-metoxy-1,4-benzoquinol methylase
MVTTNLAPSTSMSGAFVQDIAQRIVSANKLDQRHNLREALTGLNLPEGAKVLDFGCGTALFSGTIRSLGLSYYGYDIDAGIIRYAARTQRGNSLSSSFSAMAPHGPFDVVISNCCFHHISDPDSMQELHRISRVLAPGGTLLFIDLLQDAGRVSSIRRLYNKLERGTHLRLIEGYEALLSQHFTIRARRVFRAFLFSLKGNPVYNDLAVFECAVTRRETR